MIKKRLIYWIHKLCVFISPKIEINRYFFKTFGHKANLSNPQSLIEKIYWMQMHTDTSLWTLCADKYRMRDYVSSKGYGDYLPKLFGVWEKPSTIDFRILPMSFVLKANNGCGTVKIVKDKSKINIKDTIKELERWLSIPFGYSGYEPHYLKIKPCIIAEELLIQDEAQNLISPKSIIDYKVWCINGKVKSIFVAYNRCPNNLSMALYDSNWQSLACKLVSNSKDVYHPEVVIPRPQCLSLMLQIAESLSKEFPECRVDFYIIKNKPVIGEMTFSSGYGYFTEDYYNELGCDIDLSKTKIIH